MYKLFVPIGMVKLIRDPVIPGGIFCAAEEDVQSH